MQKLFDLDSEQDIHPGATAVLTHTPQRGPMLPLTIRCPIGVTEAFVFQDVSVGRIRILLAPGQSYAADQVERPDNFVPELLHVGYEFRVEALNRSTEHKRFRCEVWGIRKLDRADWEPVNLDRRSWAQGYLACVRCHICGYVLRIKVGDTIPSWCPRCIRDWEGWDSEYERQRADEENTPDAAPDDAPSPDGV